MCSYIERYIKASNTDLSTMSWARALSRHSGSGSSVRPSALPLNITTLLLSFSRCLWMSSDTTRGQSSWFSPLESTHTSTCAVKRSCLKGTYTNAHTIHTTDSLSGQKQLFTHITILVYDLAFSLHYPTSEITIGRCSMGFPGTSPSCSCFLNPCRAILLTPLFSTHSSLVFHGGDVFTEV